MTDYGILLNTSCRWVIHGMPVENSQKAEYSVIDTDTDIENRVGACIGVVRLGKLHLFLEPVFCIRRAEGESEPSPARIFQESMSSERKMGTNLRDDTRTNILEALFRIVQFVDLRLTRRHAPSQDRP